MTSLLKILQLAFPLVLIFALATGAAPIYGTPRLDQIIGAIEGNQQSWVELNARIQLQFVNSYSQGANCEGQLTYHRLGEKILLHCFDENSSLLFSFKTDDRDFIMYLPSKKSLFKGNIFDLEDSDDIDSHIQPLHLYRALKTFAIPKQFTEIESWQNERVELKIHGIYGEKSYLARRLVATLGGDVNLEVFYDHNQSPLTTIRRSDFRAFRSKKNKSLEQIRFPHQIIIETTNPRDNNRNQTIIHFGHVGFSRTSTTKEENLLIPEQTKIVEVR